MNKITLYQSNLRHIGENKYASSTILEQNLTEILEIEGPSIAVFDEFILQIELENLINANYVKYELDTKTLYYFVDSINYSVSQGIYIATCKLDIWHTYITDFWKQSTIDKNQVLEFKQATVRSDIINKTTYLYDNPYMRIIPSELASMEKIPKLNYETEIAPFTATFPQPDTPAGTPQPDKIITFTKEILDNYLWVDVKLNTADKKYEMVPAFVKIYDLVNVDRDTKKFDTFLSIAFINTNKLEMWKGPQGVIGVFITQANNTGIYLYDKDGNRLKDNSGDNYYFGGCDWDWVSTNIPKTNLLGIFKIPLDYTKYILCGRSNFTLQDNVKGYEFYINADGNEIANGYCGNNFTLCRGFYKFLNVNTWQEFYQNFIEINDFHSSLINHYEINHYYFDKVFNQKMVNIYSNDANDKPYLSFDMGTNGSNFSYMISYSDFKFNATWYHCNEIYNINPYWTNFPKYQIFYGQIDLQMASVSDSYTTWLSNNHWSGTTGIALQKGMNWAGALGAMLGGGALGGLGLYGKEELTNIDKAKFGIGAGLGAIGGIAGAWYKNKFIDGHIQDIKHTPEPLNSGNAMMWAYTTKSYNKSQIMFLADNDIANANYYYTYYGNMVSQPLTLNEYFPDKRPENDYSYLKINNFTRSLTVPVSLSVLTYFNNLFASGVRIWEKPIAFAPLGDGANNAKGK